MTKNSAIIAFVLAIAVAAPAFAQSVPSTPPSSTPPGTSPPPAMPSGRMPPAEVMKGMPASGMISTDAEAKARLEGDGYRDIKVMRGADGMWTGTAVRGSAAVTVSLDATGKIVAK